MDEILEQSLLSENAERVCKKPPCQGNLKPERCHHCKRIISIQILTLF